MMKPGASTSAILVKFALFLKTNRSGCNFTYLILAGIAISHDAKSAILQLKDAHRNMQIAELM